MAKKVAFTEAEQSEITRIQQAEGISRKAAIRKMRSANKQSKKGTKAPDFKSAAANDKTTTTPAPKSGTEAGAARSEGPLRDTCSCRRRRVPSSKPDCWLSKQQCKAMSPHCLWCCRR